MKGAREIEQENEKSSQRNFRGNTCNCMEAENCMTHAGRNPLFSKAGVRAHEGCGRSKSRGMGKGLKCSTKEFDFYPGTSADPHGFSAKVTMFRSIIQKYP